MTASPLAQVPPSSDDRIANELRHMLMPQRFPHRRDVQCSGSAGTSKLSCAFYDILWLPGGLLAMLASRIAAPGLGGALRAGVLQRMLRASVTLGLPANAALEVAVDRLGREFGTIEVDLAVAVFDPRNGRFRTAGLGRFFAGGEDGRNASAEGELPVGGRLWLVAGARELQGSDVRDPLAGMDERCLGLKAGLPGDAALVGLAMEAYLTKASHDFALPNDLAAVNRVASALEATLLREGVPESVGAAVRLAIDELVTNTISYGYPDGGWHEILVELDIGADDLTLSVRDDGRAFDPLAVLEPDLSADLEDRQVGGLGIHFVRTLMDELSYRRENGWNVLRLRKRFERESGLVSSGI